jgi:hypothetical protein
MTTMTAPRVCFYIPFGQCDDAGYIPSAVTEDEPGHAPLTGRGAHSAPWHWGKTYEEAKAICAEENARLGLSEDDVTAIVASSMAAQDG